METENWHSAFDPQKFLSRVNLEKLIDHNEAYNESKIEQGNSPCIICGSKQGPGILLNDKTYLCRSCFQEISTISYPQVYEENRRKYLQEKESRRIAFEEFTKKYGYTKEGNLIALIAYPSILLLFIHISLIVVPVVLFIVSSLINTAQEKKLAKWNKQKNEWESNYPEPLQPILRHFHDPQAHLTDKDRKILKVFNNWPGYPPFWNYLREVVLNRDRHRCQVTGCPSRTTLHVHHKKSVAQGGQHVPDNLITLCDFHHALEPDEGHERIWGSIKTSYFTFVKGHERNNRSGKGKHYVKPHLRRLKLITLDELRDLTKVYGFECPECSSTKLLFSLYSKNNKLKVTCKDCKKVWEGAQQLTEETGPRLAEFLKVTRNKGQWKARWDMLSSRTESTFKSLSSSTKKGMNTSVRSHKTTKKEDKPICPKCGSPMRLIRPRPGQSWDAFWGCTMYRITGCKGSKKA